MDRKLSEENRKSLTSFLGLQVGTDLKKTAMGRVYKALDNESKAVMVKESLISSAFIHLESPQNEVKLLRLLSTQGHPNVVRILNEKKKNHRMFTVLQWAGPDLFTMMSNREVTALNVEEAQDFFLQLMEGLKYIHSHEICHLDLSPENVCILEDRLKIIDFGQARIMNKNEDGTRALFSGKISPGKRSYKAPEIRARKDFDGVKADIWSCGVILFTCLAGFPPFLDPEYKDKRFAMIINGHLPKLLRRWKKELPDKAVDLISMILSPADKRPSVDSILSHPFLADARARRSLQLEQTFTMPTTPTVMIRLTAAQGSTSSPLSSPKRAHDDGESLTNAPKKRVHVDGKWRPGRMEPFQLAKETPVSPTSFQMCQNTIKIEEDHIDPLLRDADILDTDHRNIQDAG